MKTQIFRAAAAASLCAVSFASPLLRRQNDTDWTSQEWDAIVVGAGTAGIIVADRLSEAGKKTLLLEIGGPSYGITGGTEKPEWLRNTSLSRVDVPGLYKSIFSIGSETLLCPPGIVNSYQACAVGGNSAINAGLHFQPPASDWDDFHPDGWKSADVAGATARLLARQPSVTEYSRDGKFYLQSGYDAAVEWLVDAAGFRDVELNGEPDDKDNVFGRPAYNYIDGQRGGSVPTHLQHALARANFRLQTGVRVRRVEHAAGVASAVYATVGGRNVSIPLAPAGKVVLSAGAIASPGLLMHSGIGPSDVLAGLDAAAVVGIAPSDQVVNEAVGEGLFDNPNTFLVFSGPTIESYTHSYDNPIPADRDLYLNDRSGPYTFASQTSAFWRMMPHPDGTYTGVQGTFDSSGFGEFRGNNTITLNVYGTSGLLSSGRVVLADGGVPAPSGAIYYGHARDGETIAAFIHDLFQRLPDSTPSSPAAAGLTPLNLPRRSTLREIRDYITTPSPYAVGAVQHWSSSCRLGPCADPADARVRGTANVHVVDASIVAPLTVNPQFGVMVAAERAAERILATWGAGRGVVR
ncbi:putative cellobiose dehydrogenase [Rosellinia necatrix]|uniref:Putative cellobiose dehydrogenase n=1 Tax=Rosellinia necatrix TaxID=77044 RepID=A0A1W2TJ06_ROSNE|nr:putative cellobiose dehydrogenase [Rosellinia necatrix]